MSALIWSTFGDEAAARAAAGALLDERLVACASIVPGLRSLYRWRGERGESAEVGVLFKTGDPLLERAVARLAQLHPYETPAIVGWRADSAAPATAQWLSGLAEDAQ